MQGHQRAWAIRFWTGKVLMGGVALYAGAYYFKYNAHVSALFCFHYTQAYLINQSINRLRVFQDWTRKGGWKVMTSKKSVLPGEPGYPWVSDKVKPNDYAVNGFKSSPI